jgi:hypothetical protein
MLWVNDELKLGKFKVGSVVWDSFISKDEINKYKACLTLPGYKSNLGHFKTSNEAKERVVNAVKLWLIDAQLEEKL